MKYAIDLVSGTASSSDRSHKSSWMHMWREQFAYIYPEHEFEVLHGNIPWQDYDGVYLYQGMELKGESLNLFGGATDIPATKIARLASGYPVDKMISLDGPLMNYGSYGSRRAAGKCSDLWKATDWNAIGRVCEVVKPIYQSDLPLPNLVLGDSHSISMYQPGYRVSRNDGMTLHGAIRRGIPNLVRDAGGAKKLTLYFGNIDIRHHLCRVSPDHDENIRILLRLYEEHINTFKDDFERVELVEALPIENPSRKLPKTGYYKGKAFWGTWQERDDARKRFNEIIHSIANKLDLDVYSHPSEFFNEQGELPFEVMEFPQSVHISRRYYRDDALSGRAAKKALINRLLVF